MQMVTVRTICDHPVCQTSVSFEDHPEGQETRTIMFWVYTSGRGRKTSPIKIELCEDHAAELKDLYLAMFKFDQSVEE